MMYGYNPTFDAAIGWWVGLDGSRIPTIPTYKGQGAEFGRTTKDNWILTRYPRRKSMQKFKEAIRAKTRRTNGRSLTCIIADVNRTLAGWFEYFRHTSATTFRRLDQFVRQRLRAILLKRLKRKFRGPPRGLWYTRWTTDQLRQP